MRTASYKVWVPAARHFGYLLDGVQHGLNAGVFLGMLLNTSFVISLLGLLILSAPVVWAVAVFPPLSSFPPLVMIVIITPVIFVWQDQLFSRAFQREQGVVGIGVWDYKTLLASGKLTTVATDSLTLLIPLLFIWGLRLATRYLSLGGSYFLLTEVISTCVECLVFSFLCHTSRLDRVNVVTRGLKTLFLDRRVPYFCGFAAPPLLMVKWLSVRLSLPIHLQLLAHITLLAISTSATASIRPDDVGRPHFSIRVLSFPHKVVSIILPSSSGYGYS
eukprot:TRINITY_DN11544_c0_g1_i1.p1 TRINITY_DN11544_c0_g1~~TRINITY_DN11544_c0_g1_i1.p1  ORF type:complete len:290 (+),score=23.38 TRINITY_DN11544_c0_g1_i1:46-870(+)